MEQQASLKQAVAMFRYWYAKTIFDKHDGHKAKTAKALGLSWKGLHNILGAKKDADREMIQNFYDTLAELMLQKKLVGEIIEKMHSLKMLIEGTQK